MKAFVLAAGDGIRLRPLTSNIPKPLLLTAGKPFLQHTIMALKAAGIKDIVVLVGWMGKRIEEEFGDGKKLGVKITYLTQHQRLGTAHAIGLGRDHFKEPFLCVNGDVLVSKGLIKDILAFAKKVRGHVMALSQVPNPTEYGVISLMGSMITGIVEKPSRPKSNLVNAGVYAFKPDIFDHISRTPVSPRGEYEITTTLTDLIKDGALFGLESQYKWMDVGRPWDLLEANEFLCKELKTSIKGKVEKGVSINGPVVVEKGALVKSGTYIEGPVVIGERAVVGPNSYLRAYTCLGPDTKVGAASEVKNSIIMAHSHIPHLNYVGDSIICERCNLGAGTKIANLRLDESNIRVVLKGKYMDTGRRKLGAIIGDDVKTGINASIDVGTIIGEGTFIGPGCVARGTILPNSKIL